MNKIKVGVISTRPYEVFEFNNDVLKKTQDNISVQLDNVFYDKPDLVVLPEHADLPFIYGRESMDKKLLDDKVKYLDDFVISTQKQRIDFFSNMAKKNRVYLVYNSKLNFDNKLRNATLIINKAGEVVGKYFKNFPTPGELDTIVPSNNAKVIKTEFGTIGCVICFDFNFDELRQKYKEQKPDIIAFSSMYHGGLMQNMWAYDTRSFLLSSIASDPNPKLHSTESTIIDRAGELINKTTNYYNFVVDSINLDSKMFHIDENGPKFKDIKNKYGEKVKIKVPNYLGSVLISSESEDFSIDDIKKEFELIELDEYFDQSRVIRKRKLD